MIGCTKPVGTTWRGLWHKILGLDSDNGSEFLNTTLLDYCTDQHITFTRGRPYRKNDGYFVEQKMIESSGTALSGIQWVTATVFGVPSMPPSYSRSLVLATGLR